ncbi:MAG: HAD-IB family phosphatase [Fervidicoccaceae archaeon]
MSAFIDLDMTLTEERTIVVVERELKLDGKISEILKAPIDEKEKSKRIASILSGFELKYLQEIAAKTEVSSCGKKLISELSERGFDVYIVTLSYRQIAEPVIRKLTGKENNVKILAPELEVVSGKITGNVINNYERIETPWCIRCPLCKRRSLLPFKRRPSIAIGDSLPDICMFLETDFSILIDRGSVPENLKRFASVIVFDLCGALEALVSYLDGGRV